MPIQHVKSDDIKTIACELYISGASHNDIAKRVRICDETLRKYYGEDMHEAWCAELKECATRLKEIGMRGDTKALITWLTHRGGWYPHKAPESKNELTQALLEKIIDKL